MDLKFSFTVFHFDLAAPMWLGRLSLLRIQCIASYGAQYKLETLY
ncbi:hypothetical protein [Leptospira mayottensis]|nr:hypothetical protein [Leptospira mayottensis]